MYNMFGLDDEVALSVVLVALCQWHDPVAFCRAFFQSNLITALYSLVGEEEKYGMLKVFKNIRFSPRHKFPLWIYLEHTCSCFGRCNFWWFKPPLWQLAFSEAISKQSRTSKQRLKINFVFFYVNENKNMVGAFNYYLAVFFRYGGTPPLPKVRNYDPWKISPIRA